MQHRYRRLLVWVLLAFTLFNATAGTALHEALHVQEAVALAAADTQDEREAKADDHHCLVCRLAAQMAAEVRLDPPPLGTVVLPAASPTVPAAVGFTAAPPRWRYAARDPPVSSH